MKTLCSVRSYRNHFETLYPLNCRKSYRTNIIIMSRRSGKHFQHPTGPAIIALRLFRQGKTKIHRPAASSYHRRRAAREISNIPSIYKFERENMDKQKWEPAGGKARASEGAPMIHPQRQDCMRARAMLLLPPPAGFQPPSERREREREKTRYGR